MAEKVKIKGIIKLSVIERVLLGSMMAAYVGNFTNLKLVRKAQEALSFNEEENKELKFVQNGDNVNWDIKTSIKFQAVEIDIGEHVTSIIKDMLFKLNKEEKLTNQHFSLYEKFIRPDINEEV